MLNLYAKKLGDGTPVALDLMEDQPISVSLQFQTLQDANTVGGSFSQSFRIPASKTNSDFFDHWEGVGETSTNFNPKNKSDAWITDNGIPILQGALQLVSVVKVEGRPKHYEVLVVGSTGGLITDVGNKKLSDLEWDDLDHKQTSTELQALLANTLAASSTIDASYSGHFAYGLMDKHPTYTNYQQTPIKNFELTPFLKVRKVLDAIFAASDSSYSSTFFSSGEGNDVWMPVYNGKKDLGAQGNTTPANFVARLDEVTNAFAGGVVGDGFSIPDVDGVTCGTGTVHPLPLTEHEDSNNVFDASTNAFTAPATRVYTFVCVGSKINRSEAFTHMRLRLKKNSSTVVHDEYLPLFEPTFNPQTFQFVTQIPLSQNDVITLEITTPSSQPSTIGLTALEFFQDDSAVTSTTTNNVDLAGAMPDITCQAFLDGLQRAFNLVFVPNEHNAAFQIEPASDFLNTGNPLDWSKKVDLSTDMQILPTTDLQSRVYEFNHAEASDLMNEAFQESAGRVAGRMRIEDTDNDWASGVNSIETCFAPFIAVDTNLGFPGFVAYNSDGEFTDEAPPMLCYLNSSNFAYQYRVQLDGSTLQNSTMCLFTPFSAAPSIDQSKALLFGPDIFRAGDVQPEHTLFNKYWGDYFRSLYFQESKILKCKMFLTRTDINQLDFSDTIHLREGVFRVLSITNYTANAEETCDVELLQTAGEVRLCEFTDPRGQAGGIITFTNAQGTTGQAGTKKCCEYYGYVWNGSQCISPPANTPTPVPTSKDVTDLQTVIGVVDTSKPLSDFTQAISLNATRTAISSIELEDAAISADKIETDGERNFVNQGQLETIGTDSTARATANAAKAVTDLIDTDSEGITGFTKGDGVTILTTEDIGETAGRTFLSSTESAKLSNLTITAATDLDDLRQLQGHFTHTSAGITGITFPLAAAPISAVNINTVGTTLRFIDAIDLPKLASINADNTGIKAIAVSPGFTPLTADQISDSSTTNKFTTSGNLTKLGHITVDAAVDLADVGTNTANITTNAFTASQNATGVSQNSTAIQQVATIAANNATAITTNATAISNNAAAITDNANDITALQADASDFENALDLNNNGQGSRGGQTGVEIATFNSSGVLGSIDDGSSGQLLTTNGSGVLTFQGAGWHGNQTLIKVSPTEWVGNDLGRAIVQVRIEDDTTNTLGVQINQATGTIFAFNEIPNGYKATHVEVHASSTVTNGVDVKHFDITTGATTNSTTGNTNASIDITDMTASTTNMLSIAVTPGATNIFVYGATITIVAV